MRVRYLRRRPSVNTLGSGMANPRVAAANAVAMPRLFAPQGAIGLDAVAGLLLVAQLPHNSAWKCGLEDAGELGARFA